MAKVGLWSAEWKAAVADCGGLNSGDVLDAIEQVLREAIALIPRRIAFRRKRQSHDHDPAGLETQIDLLQGDEATDG